MGFCPKGIMRRIEALVHAAEAEHPDEELRQLLRNLVPDFHPHPTPPIVTSDGDGRELSVRDTPEKEAFGPPRLARVGHGRA